MHYYDPSILYQLFKGMQVSNTANFTHFYKSLSFLIGINNRIIKGRFNKDDSRGDRAVSVGPSIGGRTIVLTESTRASGDTLTVLHRIGPNQAPLQCH